MLYDPKHTLQRGMVYLFAIMANLGIGPFVVIRYLNGELLNALVDLAIVIAAIICALITFRQGYVSKYVSIGTAALYSTGAIIVTHVNDPIFVFWLFPCALANFFLLSTHTALIANLLCVVAVLPIAARLENTTEQFAMLATLMMCGGMAYTFALLTDRQRDQLQGFASQDALTQLGNRRAMNAELELSIQDYKRHQTPTTLILLDLDFFKAINDKFGHSVGDKMLIALADLLMRRVRKTDRLFRFGGEEFVIIARNTSLAEAHKVADDLRTQIATKLKDPEGNFLSASFGCAQLQAHETAEDWFVRADKAVYKAKQDGRNCVVTIAA
jgi:diguanylate cyclase (GGDEF)-like protein